MTEPKNLLITLALFAGFLNLGFNWSNYNWQKINSGISESEITCIVANPQENSIIFAGTPKAVYRSVNKGKDFQAIFRVPGSDRRVNFLYIAPRDSQTVYAATNSGLFSSKDSGKAWEQAFNASDAKERQCLWVTADDSSIYLATMAGLFYRDIKGKNWQKIQGGLDSVPVFFLTDDAQYLYAATGHEVFRLEKKNQEVRKVFSLVAHEVNGNAQSVESEIVTDKEGQTKQINFMTTTEDSRALYLATTKGIFKSPDQGGSWERLNSDSLPLEEATSLAVMKDGKIFVGTQKGVFGDDNGRWTQVYKGMETNEINFLNSDFSGALYAATNKGIFVLAENNLPVTGNLPKPSSVNKYFAGEPSINEVQKMAIEYAEVDPSKISLWRRQAQYKAFMPEVSLDFDKTVTTALGSTYDRTAVGPQDWGVNLKWNIGELIWNADQTSIDSRSKLMVELREDVLDQVTRLYFERRRLQIELLNTQALQDQEHLDKEMRVAELTALIDGFTGGQFSRKIIEQEKFY